MKTYQAYYLLAEIILLYGLGYKPLHDALREAAN